MVPLIDLMQYQVRRWVGARARNGALMHVCWSCQARDEPTVQGAFASEDAVGFVHTIVDSTPVGTILTYTPPVEVANCNIGTPSSCVGASCVLHSSPVSVPADLVLHRGLVVNATKWDCAYVA